MSELSEDFARSPGAHRAALLGRFKAARQGDEEVIHPAPRDGDQPQSHNQRQLWLLDRLTPGRSTYNVPVGLRLTGRLDVAALRLALGDVVARHETLRTSLHEQCGEPVQRVHDVVDIDLPVVDTGDRAVAAGQAERLTREPFDLATAPLWRARLLRIAPEDHLFVFVVHHVVCDGWSLHVFTRDLSACYRRRTTGTTSLDPLPIQYVDYTRWQRDRLRGVRRDELAEYWRQRLTGAPTLELPSDRPRAVSAQPDGASVRVLVERSVADSVHAFAQAQGVTSYVAYLTIFAVLLHRYSGQDDLVIGSPCANRSVLDTESMIGFFATMLALRLDASADPTVAELAGRVHRTVQDAMAHSELPFDAVVEAVQPPRDPARTPVFQISLGLQTEDTLLDLPAVRCARHPIDPDTSRFDLSLNLTELADGLEVQVEYDAGLFDRETVEALAAHYSGLLTGLPDSARTAISDLPLLTDAEFDELVHRWNGPRLDIPDTTVPAMFAQHVEQNPDAVALVAGRREYGYGELDRRANRLAHLLIEHGVTPGSRVALCLPREVELIVSVLAVLKAGAAYVPVDSAHPPARLAAVFADAGPAAVITHSSLAGLLPDDGVPTLVIDAVAGRLAEAPDTDPAVPITPDDVAYVIYTSGTTGSPKGVLIEHRSVVAFITAVTDLFVLTARDRVLGFASATFDVSVFEMFSALLNGAQLVLARDDERLSMPALQRLIETNRITVTDLPPTVMALLSPEHFDALRIVFVGGEAFPAELVNGWNPGRRLFNGYGPTECTVTTIVHECPGRWASSPPIGLPMANHVAHVVDRHLRPVPYGVAGELVIGGAGLTRGYLNAAELTVQKIIPDPFGTAPGSRLYHTGDLVKRRRDGAIVFLGRIDRQVKIRGLRIELGEIETALAEHPDVGQVAVLPWTDEDGEKYLVAYLSAAQGARPVSGELREHLGALLPRYMVPAYFVMLDTLPLTASGKVDLPALPDPDRSATRGEFAEPTTQTERVLAEEIMAGLLGMPRVGIHDDFFELGGNSLQATQLISRIRDRFGVEVRLADFFASPTVAQLARVIDMSIVDSLTDEELLALIQRMPAEQAAQLLDGDTD